MADVVQQRCKSQVRNLVIYEFQLILGGIEYSSHDGKYTKAVCESSMRRVWICDMPQAELLQMAQPLEGRRADNFPLCLVRENCSMDGIDDGTALEKFR